MSSPRVVALGGGHGLANTLSALRTITDQITAIVTVADNGGSSGRLRAEFPIFPPGDLRMALAALCSDDEWGRSWAQIMQYRFTSDGDLDGHAVGNLLLAALWDRDEDPVQGLDRVGTLLKVIGRVLPMASVPLDIEGRFNTSTGRIVVRGQKEVATAKGRIESLTIIPENPRARPEALDAIRDAQWITMGPGSWFSSVIPHLLVPQQRDALISSPARKVVILNLELFHRYAPDLRIDYFLVDPSVVRNRTSLESLARQYGGELVIGDIRKAPGSVHHDEKKLASQLSHIFNQSLLG